MVRLSNNDATTRVVEASGGLNEILQRIKQRTGVTWKPAPTWGSVEVTAHEVAKVMQALAASADGQRALKQMRSVPLSQSFGALSAWSELTNQPVKVLGVKAGWDLHPWESQMRTHVTVIGPDRSVVVLTAIPVCADVRREWAAVLERGGAAGVIRLHHEVAGHSISDALVTAAKAG